MDVHSKRNVEPTVARLATHHFTPLQLAPRCGANALEEPTPSGLACDGLVMTATRLWWGRTLLQILPAPWRAGCFGPRRNAR